MPLLSVSVEYENFVKRFINKLRTHPKRILCRGRITCEGIHPFETRMRFMCVQAQQKKEKKFMPWSHKLDYSPRP